MTERSNQVFNITCGHVREVRLMLADGNIDAKNGIRLKEILNGLAEMCYLDGDKNGLCHPINQQMLYNFGTSLIYLVLKS